MSKQKEIDATDTERLEWLMGRMYRQEHDRYFENGQPRQDWHMTTFSIPRGISPFENWMSDMRAVIDVAMTL